MVPGVSTACGALLVLAGVLAARLPETVHVLVDAFPAIARVALHDPASHPALVLFPDTFLLALALVLAGAAVLLAAVPGSGGVPRERPLAKGSVLAVWILATGLLAFFGFAVRKGFHHHPAATGAYLVLVVGAAALFLRRDRMLGAPIGVRLSRAEVVGLLAGCAAYVGTAVRQADSWKFSFIGDEWAFFTNGYLPSRNLLEIPWLEANGVYGQWPVAISGWQILFEHMFGFTNFAWRLSMAVMLALCLPPLYLILRHLLTGAAGAPRTAAALGCSLFAFSELIVDWGRIGYTNAGFVPPLVFASALVLAARARGTASHYFMAGLVAGLGIFLSSLSALLPMGVLCGAIVLDAIVWGRRDLRHALVTPLLLLGAGFLVAGAPILMDVPYWNEQVALNFAGHEAQIMRPWLASRTFESAILFLGSNVNSHFLSGNVVDPITAFFAAAGLGMARFLGVRRMVFPVFCLLSVAFLTGGIAPYPHAPVTRLAPLMFPVAVLAAIGFAGLTRRWRWAAPLLALGLAVPCALYNVLKLETWNPYRNIAEYQMLELKRLEEAPARTVHALVLPPDQAEALSTFLDHYGRAGQVRLFRNTPRDRERLFALMARAGADLEVQLWPSVDDREIRAAALARGARVGPTLQAAVPQRGGDEDQRLVALFDSLNPS
jgi:hypothetical protein